MKFYFWTTIFKDVKLCAKRLPDRFIVISRAIDPCFTVTLHLNIISFQHQDSLGSYPKHGERIYMFRPYPLNQLNNFKVLYKYSQSHKDDLIIRFLRL